MVRTDPDFQNFADELRREEQQDAIIKSKVGTDDDPQIQEQRAIERRLSVLRKFRMDRGELPPVLFVINLESGQVAATKSDGDSDSDYLTSHNWNRIGSKDTLRWLGKSSVRARTMTEFDLSSLPDWLNTKSEEPVPLLRKMARTARMKSFKSFFATGVVEVVQGILGFFMMAALAIIVIVGAVIAIYGLSQFLTGIQGLLEFGCKQL